MDDSRRCTATSKRSGQRCRRAAIAGGTVCRAHGGAAPQVRNAARRRLLKAADPAAARLVDALADEDSRTAVRAADLILRRASVDTTVEFELPAIESIEDALAASSALLRAVAEGSIDVDAGERLQRLLAGHVGLVEAATLADRINELERLLAEREADAERLR